MAYPTEAPRQNHRSPPQRSEVAPADDIRTIMLNQVAWGAVFAGAVIGLVMQIILNMVGLGVGLSTMDIAQGDAPSAGSMSVGAGIWFVVSGIVAAALGGYVLAGFRQSIAIDDGLSRSNFLGGLDAHCGLSSLVGCVWHDRWRRQHGVLGSWWSR